MSMFEAAVWTGQIVVVMRVRTDPVHQTALVHVTHDSGLVPINVKVPRELCWRYRMGALHCTYNRYD